jgi:putative membrane protein
MDKPSHLQDWTRGFLSAEDRERIARAIRAAESVTAGEIVCLIVPSSHHYPLAAVRGGAALALPLAIPLTMWIGGWLWLGAYDMWLFMGIAAALFTACHEVLRRAPGLKRWFIAGREAQAEVEEAAFTAFFRHDLHRTREATGILIFVSVLERRVWILADQGIDAQVAQGHWEGVVARIADGIRGGRAAEAICRAVEEIGELLRGRFPRRPDDTNELPDLLVKG